MDDDLEPIDLSDLDLRDLERRDLGLGNAVPAGPEPLRHRSALLVPRRAIVLSSLGAVVVLVAGLSLIAHSGSRSRAGTTSTTRRPPSGLAGIAAGPFVAVVDDTVVLVDADGSVRRLVEDTPGAVVVGASAGGSVLVSSLPHDRIIASVSLDARRVTLPAALTLLPSADGRWWSNFGLLDAGSARHPLRVPLGTTPVARLSDGYLLVNTEQTALLDWRPPTSPRRIGVGHVRMLAVARDLVAWRDDSSNGSVTRVTDLATGRTVAIGSGGFAISARFSPDGSRLAILVSAERDSTVLADASSGRVLARVTTASPSRGLPTRDDLPLAFQPVPFSWNRSGSQLLVLANVGPVPIIDSLAAADGTLARSVSGPQGLEQLVVLRP